ncbi:ATP-grasp domain-containing protein [Nitrosophilus alvini]|uniref:ATP-grasp domain-containing protein n=1 Tax=Nitrosophilus alvini TaxID=2714855 RepID=UPI00190D7CDE|nr:ATP-grasp domain-containing protein [Nitrosophilus alvini]
MIVAVSGINDTDNPGPGIGVARSLKEADPSIKTVGLSYDVQDPGNYMDFVIDKSYILSFPTQGWEPIFNRLLYIKESYGLDVVIPTLDAELPQYIKYQNDLEEAGIKTFLPSLEQFELRSKENLQEVSKKISITYPETKKVFTVDQLTKAVKEIGLPCIVKGNYYKAYKAKSLPEAVYYFTEISNEWGFPILVQEIVSGEELNVIGAGDGKGGVLGLVAIKKMTTTNLGKIWNGVTIKHDKLLKTAENFVKQYKWKGPFELECIVDGDEIIMIEINPRFPAWVYFATAVGVNLPKRVLEEMFDKSTDTNSDYKAGKMMVRYTYEMITDIEKLSTLATKGESDG